MRKSFYLLAFLLLSCSKDNDVSQTNTTIGDLCGPKVACADGTCAFGYCRNACTTDSDCANSGVCLSDGQTKGCRLPFEASCAASDPCPTGLSCGSDESCRVPCDATRPCEVEGQRCEQGSCTSALGGNGGTGGTGATGGNGGTGAGGSGGTNGGAGGTGGSVAGAGGAAGTGAASGAGGTGGCSPTLGGACCSGSCDALTTNMVCTNQVCECDIGATDCDSNPDNGCEAVLLSDPLNCKSCGHDCGGGACTAGICQPHVLIPEGGGDGEYYSDSDHTAVDSSGIVATSIQQSSGVRQLRAFDRQGNPGAFLTNETSDVVAGFGPFLAGGSVWFGTYNGNLQRVSRSGGAVTTPITEAMLEAHVDSDWLYFRSYNGFFGIAPGTVTASQIYTQSVPGIFAVSGSAMFFSDGIDLREGSTGGAAVQTRYAQFFIAGCTLRGLVADANAVYGFGGCGQVSLGTARALLVKYDRNSGQRTVLVQDDPSFFHINYMVLDGTTGFAADGLSNPLQLLSIDLSTGAFSRLSSTYLYGLAQDADYLYGKSGGLVRTRKP